MSKPSAVNRGISSFFHWVSLTALLGGLLTGCGPALGGAPATGTQQVSPRQSVLACFSAEYKRHYSAAPSIDETDRQDADRLLARYNGKVKRACGQIRAALSGSLCGMPATLASVIACERRHRRVESADLNPATKTEMLQRIRDRDMRQVNPNYGP